MWHTIKAYGFIYYECWLSNTGVIGPICWISRQSTKRYQIFYCDGFSEAGGSRGSYVNARKYAAELIAFYLPLQRVPAPPVAVVTAVEITEPGTEKALPRSRSLLTHQR